MNKVSLVGRLTRDPEIKYSDGGSSIARFSIAVQRRFTTENGPDADFISCVAFGKTAEFIEKYFIKGMAIGIAGRIQTGSYTNKDGAKVYTTDVVVEEAEFVERKASTSGEASQNVAGGAGEGFMNIPEGIEEELPFGS